MLCNCGFTVPIEEEPQLDYLAGIDAPLETANVCIARVDSRGSDSHRIPVAGRTGRIDQANARKVACSAGQTSLSRLQYELHHRASGSAPRSAPARSKSSRIVRAAFPSSAPKFPHTSCVVPNASHATCGSDHGHPEAHAQWPYLAMVFGAVCHPAVIATNTASNP
jgi:hypothetical protein